MSSISVKFDFKKKTRGNWLSDRKVIDDWNRFSNQIARAKSLRNFIKGEWIRLFHVGEALAKGYEKVRKR